jgi:hypothetical protein
MQNSRTLRTASEGTLHCGFRYIQVYSCAWDPQAKVPRLRFATPKSPMIEVCDVSDW